MNIKLLLLGLAFLFGNASLQARPSTVEGDQRATLRVLCYNTYYVFSNGTEVEAATAWISEQAPDVVALQELTNIEDARLAELAAGWGHGHSALLKTSGFSVGLTSRYPIEVVDRLLDGLHHGSLHARVRGIDVFVVHLSPFEWKVREREAALLLAKIKPLLDQGEEVLVLGDFNALSAKDKRLLDAQPELMEKARNSEVEHDHVRNLRDGEFDYGVMQRFFDAGLQDVVLPQFEGVGQKAGESRWTFTTGIWTEEKSSAPEGGNRIDFVLADATLARTVASAEIPRGGVLNRTSDHYPVIVDFDRSAAASSVRVDSSSLKQKVMCGYQGWFACEGDGAGLGWVHWGRRRADAPGPGNITVDLWPDVSEYGADELFETQFSGADGKAARVFSSYRPGTVRRHFRWMRDYGIDGAFVQRFANGIGRGKLGEHKDRVLANARVAASEAGRVYAVMYDLSGLASGGVDVVLKDWLELQEQRKIIADASYLHHGGKPLVAVWGIGFNDGRKYTLEECTRLVQGLKQAGCAVMLGVPTGWRTGTRDAVGDAALQELVAMADVISPWSVGRYRTPKAAHVHGSEVWKLDVKWCSAHGADLLPVVFPGFSWANLKGAELGAIPRLGGKFLWAQMVAAKRAGCEMIYVAMFDEVDEGTAIFKCTDSPPTSGPEPFLTNEGLPSDHYLRLTGLGGKLLRGEMELKDEMPQPIGKTEGSVGR